MSDEKRREQKRRHDRVRDKLPSRMDSNAARARARRTLRAEKQAASLRARAEAFGAAVSNATTLCQPDGDVLPLSGPGPTQEVAWCFSCWEAMSEIGPDGCGLRRWRCGSCKGVVHYTPRAADA